MGNPILLLNTEVKMQNALGTDKAITAISKVLGPVLTCVHDFVVGDLVVISKVQGMTEINGLAVRVKAVSTTVSWTAEELDASKFSTYVSGGVANKVMTYHVFDNLASFNFPQPDPTKIPVTTIHDSSKKEIFGLDEPVNISMSTISDPTGPVAKALRVASRAKTTLVFNAKTQTGMVLIFNAYVSGGRGFEGSAGDVATSQINMTLAADEQYFAS